MSLSSTLLLAAFLPAHAKSDTIPLFASDELVELTLEADFDALHGDRANDPEERPGRD